MRSSPHPAGARRQAARRTAAVAAIAAGALALASCSTTGDDQSGAGSQPLPGITATSVNVGFTIVDIGELAAALGFKQPDYGGVEGQTKAINAVVDHINANGGMGGRQVTATIKPYLAGSDSPAAAQAQCSAYTQDLKVFAVVLDGGFQTSAVPCYAAGNTLVLDESLIAHDTAQFESTSPYLWSPTHPEYGGFLKAQLEAMNDAGFFEGNTGVLLMPSDDEVSRRTADTVAKPYLASIGITKVQTSFVDSTDTGTLGQTAAAALVAGKNGKLNRVMVIGGARILPVTLSDQNANNYDSKWAISTYDNPAFVQTNGESIVTELRKGMTGLGYAPSQDVDQAQQPPWPDPGNPYQQKCVDIITAAGAVPPDNLRTNWKNALQYCDAAMFLKAVLDNLPGAAEVTGLDFKDAAGLIGGTYGSAIGFSSQWGPGIYAGTNGAQTLQWDESCECFTYNSETRTFGTIAAPPVSAGTTPSAPSSVATTPSAPASVATSPSAPGAVPTSPGAPPPVGTGSTITPRATITANP